MTDLLDRAVPVARALPASAQDEVAQVVLKAASASPYAFEPLSAKEEASFDPGNSAANLSATTSRRHLGEVGLLIDAQSKG